ncbi:ATP-binding cassette domain-containing protein [Amaricoccus solimangrovi]|uniref:Sugar ABC transporter ATP-binding protein n=1 Tax=Amaricoccus solimangrovi TaxID=2589815 RepID=A0A501WUB4_9RHOB|nr:ATP-binding cassette domain-containing protein [Amaricoccus solimangrovi]TPE51744.1 sugar ABC transporter ATP-binding protein [Amaricoccus solimangrovi]
MNASTAKVEVIAPREPRSPGVKPAGTPLLEMRNIVKRYGAFVALNRMNFHIGENEVVGLLGDNGAGKSTLVKMMSGINPPTSGEIYARGGKVALNCRADSEAAGIETIYQDIALVDSMPITRNIFMGREITNRWGFMKHKAMERTAIEILGSAVQISGIDDPEKEVGFLSGGQKQAVAIARAVHFKRNILLLDEPTSALSVRETEHLLGYVRDLKSEGTSSVLVTHNIYHAFQVCDRFVVMSHGAKVFEARKEDTTIEEVTDHVIRT